MFGVPRIPGRVESEGTNTRDALHRLRTSLDGCFLFVPRLIVNRRPLRVRRGFMLALLYFFRKRGMLLDGKPHHMRSDARFPAIEQVEQAGHTFLEAIPVSNCIDSDTTKRAAPVPLPCSFQVPRWSSRNRVCL